MAPTINIVPSYHPTALKYIPNFINDFEKTQDIFWVATVYDTSSVGFFLEALQHETGIHKTSKIVTKKIGKMWIAAIGMKHNVEVVKSSGLLNILVKLGLIKRFEND